MSGHALHQVIAIPRNGYINRLQAWASAAILADVLDVPARLLWEPEAAAPTGADELFDPGFLGECQISRAEVDALLGRDHQELPRYLHALHDRGVIVLAGHDRGEQVFMSQLQDMLAAERTMTSFVIIAGGKFHLPATVDFEQARRDFYRSLQWSTSVESRVQDELKGREPFLAVHVRQTDRALTAPTARSMRSALSELHEHTHITPVFVAADTAQARDQWQSIARSMGLDPWSSAAKSHDRGSASGGVDAMVDWRILTAAQGLVYSAESSFGQEAAVAIGSRDRTVGLTASGSLQRARTTARLAHAALTYPRRRLGR